MSTDKPKWANVLGILAGATIVNPGGLIDRFGALCSEGVTRAGEFQPCDKTAVALRVDPEEGAPYAVCAYHSREQMLSLADLDELTS